MYHFQIDILHYSYEIVNKKKHGPSDLIRPNPMFYLWCIFFFLNESYYLKIRIQYHWRMNLPFNAHRCEVEDRNRNRRRFQKGGKLAFYPALVIIDQEVAWNFQGRDNHY